MYFAEMLLTKVTPLADYQPSFSCGKGRSENSISALSATSKKAKINRIVAYKNAMGDDWLYTKEILRRMGLSSSLNTLKSYRNKGLIEQKKDSRGMSLWHFVQGKSTDEVIGFCYSGMNNNNKSKHLETFNEYKRVMGDDWLRTSEIDNRLSKKRKTSSTLLKKWRDQKGIVISKLDEQGILVWKIQNVDG